MLGLMLIDLKLSVSVSEWQVSQKGIWPLLSLSTHKMRIELEVIVSIPVVLPTVESS